MQHGFFLIDKQSGPSSAKALYPIKKISGVEKVGHAGTLDPLASGLLVVGINRATRLLGFVQSGKKIYSGTFVLGKETDTYDIQGQITAEDSTIVDPAAVIDASRQFIGVQQQQPPIYSALKVKGVPSYALARKGEAVDLQSREIIIDSFDVEHRTGQEYGFRCACGTGTYIRSLIFDLGRTLKVGACLTTLRRNASLPFDVSNAVASESASMDSLIPWWKAFDIPQLSFTSQQILALVRGQQDFLLQESEKIINAAGTSELLLYTNEDAVPEGLLRKRPDSPSYELLLHINL